MSTHQVTLVTYREKNKAGKRDEDCWRKCSCEEVKKGGSYEEIKDINAIKGCEEVKNCEELFLRRDQRLRRDRFLRRDQELYKVQGLGRCEDAKKKNNAIPEKR